MSALPAKVTISGHGFRGATAVMLGGRPLRYKVASDAEIIATVPAGSKSGLFTVSVGRRTATSPFSFSVPTNPIDVKRNYGIGDSEIRAAIAAAESSGRALYFSAATYTFNSTLPMTGISAYGDGRHTVLEATRPLASAIILRGRDTALHDLKVTSPNAAYRDNSGAAASVQVDGADHFVVQNVSVNRAANSGVIVLAGSEGTIATNSVRNTFSDGIHMTDGSSDITVIGNRVRDSGDDMIAVVSYVGRDVCTRILITGNDVSGQTSGRGISTVGGENVTISRNRIASTSGAGIYVGAEDSWNTLGTRNVRVMRNAVSSTDLGHIHHAAIHVIGRSEHPVQGTIIARNVVRNANYRGIFVGADTQSTTISKNRVAWVAEQGIYVDGGRDVAVRGNRVSDVGTFGIYATRAVAGNLLLTQNTLRNVNRFGISWVDVIMVESDTSLEWGEVSYNSYEDPGNYPIDRLVESSDPRIAVFANTRTG